jgi:chromosome partitioning protein
MLLVACASPKGGVGKSTISRMLAREFAAAGWRLEVADLDTANTSTYSWVAARDANAIEPRVRARVCPALKQALAVDGELDMLILDCRAGAGSDALEIARRADVLVVPTSPSRDDVEPSVAMARSLSKRGVDTRKLIAVLNRTSDNHKREWAARGDLERAGVEVVQVPLPQRPAFEAALDMGQALTEVPYAALRKKAERVSAAICAFIEARQPA